MSLCPKSALTCIRLFVLWYSTDALKCLKSYSRIVLKVGSWSFSANLFPSLRYCSLMFFDLHLNSRSSAFRCFFRMYCFSISRVLGLSFPTLPTVCFAPVMLTVLFSKSMSETFSHVSSTGLVPRSFDMDRINAILGDAWDISMSIFSCVGTFIGLFVKIKINGINAWIHRVSDRAWYGSISGATKLADPVDLFTAHTHIGVSVTPATGSC